MAHARAFCYCARRYNGKCRRHVCLEGFGPCLSDLSLDRSHQREELLDYQRSGLCLPGQVMSCERYWTW